MTIRLGVSPVHPGPRPWATNICTNPSFESNITGPSGVNGGTLSHLAAAAIPEAGGSFGMRVSCPANGTADSGVNLGPTVTVSEGELYTYSVYLRARTAGTYNTYLAINSGTSSYSRMYTADLAVGEVVRLTTRDVARGSGLATWYILRGDPNVVVDFDLDGLMVTTGSTLWPYADGGTRDWSWSGTAGSSTSSGPL